MELEQQAHTDITALIMPRPAAPRWVFATAWGSVKFGGRAPAGSPTLAMFLAIAPDHCTIGVSRSRRLSACRATLADRPSESSRLARRRQDEQLFRDSHHRMPAVPGGAPRTQRDTVSRREGARATRRERRALTLKAPPRSGTRSPSPASASCSSICLRSPTTMIARLFGREVLARGGVDLGGVDRA